MSDINDTETGKGRLSLRPAARTDVGRTVDAGSVRQSFSHGRSKPARRLRLRHQPHRPPIAAPCRSRPGRPPMRARRPAPAR